MGNSCGNVGGSVIIEYKGREHDCPLCTNDALKRARTFVEFVQHELLLRGALDEKAHVRVFWKATGGEVCDADFKNLKALRKRGMHVRVERSAESDAVLDNYKLEESLTQSFAHQLTEETHRISSEGLPAHLALDCKSPDFNALKFQELEETLRKAGAAGEVDRLMADVRKTMGNNVRLLNQAAVLAQQVHEKFPVVARGLRSGDGAYVAEAIALQAKNIEGILQISGEACAAMANLREALRHKHESYKVDAGMRSCVNSSGIAFCTAVPIGEAALTTHALGEGAAAASQSPFTAWLTSQSVHMHYWTSPGGLLHGSKVHATAMMVYHFHVASFLCSGGIALAALGGLAAFCRYRWRRLNSWRQAADLVGPTMDALQANEDYWCGLCFPCDQILRVLEQVKNEPKQTSHHAMLGWQKVFKDTHILITAIDQYFVWLDLAGWVPVSFGVRRRLQQLNASDPYDMLAEMINAPPKLRPRSSRPRLLDIRKASSPGVGDQTPSLPMLENAPAATAEDECPREEPEAAEEVPTDVPPSNRSAEPSLPSPNVENNLATETDYHGRDNLIAVPANENESLNNNPFAADMDEGAADDEAEERVPSSAKPPVPGVPLEEESTERSPATSGSQSQRRTWMRTPAMVLEPHRRHVRRNRP